MHKIARKQIHVILNLSFLLCIGNDTGSEPESQCSLPTSVSVTGSVSTNNRDQEYMECAKFLWNNMFLMMQRWLWVNWLWPLYPCKKIMSINRTAFHKINESFSCEVSKWHRALEYFNNAFSFSYFSMLCFLLKILLTYRIKSKAT